MAMQANTMSKRWFLIGMMGSGKSYWAHKLSAKLNIPALDTDQLLVKQHQQSIASIFESKGADQFRLFEKNLMMEYPWPAEAIVATGGGLPCYHENMERLLQLGSVVFLDPPLETLVERLWSEISERPLVSASGDKKALKERIGNLLLERRPFYEMATWTLTQANLTMTDWDFVLNS